MIPIFYVYAVYFLCVGLLIGSFLGVCIDRIPRGETVVYGRSRCNYCDKTLLARDMVPLLSFALLKGRCRFCGEKLSLRYPLIELLTGLVFLTPYLLFGLSVKTILICLLGAALVVVAFIDHDTGMIPDRLHVFLLLLGIAAAFFDREIPLTDRLIGFFIISVPMLVVACVASGFGGGDIKLCAVCGLFLGWKAILLAALVACVTAAISAVWQMMTQRKSGRSAMAFGPYLAVGIYFSAVAALPVITWYLSLFQL